MIALNFIVWCWRIWEEAGRAVRQPWTEEQRYTP